MTEAGSDSKELSASISARLLEEVQLQVTELNPHRQHLLRVTLDSSLDRELGLDSLSRVELFSRLERVFNVTLPDALLGTAESPRDLLNAVESALEGEPREGVASWNLQGGSSASSPLLSDYPAEATTLVEMLEWHLKRHPQRPHVYLYEDSGKPLTITYADLFEGARSIASGLQAHGILPGQSVAIMLPTSREYLFSFFAILLAGCVPVPIYPPLRPSQLEDHLRRHSKILENAKATLLITVDEAKLIGNLLKGQIETLTEVITARQLAESDSAFRYQPMEGHDVAFLQYTSGSTGQPKGVVLTHAELLSNIRAMGEAVQADSSDVFVSWLPLYHDMGLIGAWLGSLYYGMQLVLMSPLSFLSRPARWLTTIEKHGGTLTAAPNFGYEFCLNKVDDESIRGLDLSSLRMAFNGAEPVSPKTLRRFSERFAFNGLRSDVLAPVYGLAEAAVGLAFPPGTRRYIVDRIDREAFLNHGRAVPVSEKVHNPIEFVACGQPLPGYQIRIVDSGGRELPEREEGHLQFKGPSATSGYFRNPEATSTLYDDGWLDSGDLAYIADGDVYVTSRVKDTIIRGGRNIYPYELEEAVGEIPGIRKGCVAVFGSPDPWTATERLVVVAETRKEDENTRARLQGEILAVAIELLGEPPDVIMLAAPHSVLKTSSGKIRRAAVRVLFEEGKIGHQQKAAWWQIARLSLASWRSSARRMTRWLMDTMYAGYAHAVFWLLAPLVWLLVVLLPMESWRWQVIRGGARLLFRLCGVPLLKEGIDNIPASGASVFVANHSSYLDGVVLVAALPAKISFVAKAELREKIIPRLFLERIGAEFVERFDSQQSVEDARHALHALESERSLLFFPEGTFSRMPGLLPFHMGAFVAAAVTDAPVVPIAIRGTRSILRGRNKFPRRGVIRLAVTPEIHPEGADWSAAVELRNKAREQLLEHLGEPDLSRENLGI